MKRKRDRSPLESEDSDQEEVGHSSTNPCCSLIISVIDEALPPGFRDG
jgi:hypothetical protein